MAEEGSELPTAAKYNQVNKMETCKTFTCTTTSRDRCFTGNHNQSLPNSRSRTKINHCDDSKHNHFHPYSNKQQPTTITRMKPSRPTKRFLSIPLITAQILFHCLVLVLVLHSISRETYFALAQSHDQQYIQHNNILHFEVFENVPNNTWIGNIRSSDGQHPHIIVALPNGVPESELLAAFSVNFSNGDLTTNGQLDRERRDWYSFVAIVGQPVAEIKCTIAIKDVNDNAPTFRMAPNETKYIIEMPEGQRGVRRVLPLAYDLDTAEFGIVEFRSTSHNTPSGMFTLVEHDSPARNLASARDDSSGNNILASETDAQVKEQLAQQATVLIPSQQPLMQSPASSLAISSGSNTGAPVVSPAGTAGANNPNSFLSSSTAISSAGPGSVPNSNGLLSAQNSKYLIDLEVTQPLDRENQSSYQLTIEASDRGQTPLVGRLVVIVNVQDINDNDPIFERELYEIRVKENTHKDTQLLTVQAHDADIDLNGQITYSIKRHSSSSQPSILSDNNNEVSSNTRYSLTSATTTTTTTTNNNNNNINAATSGKQRSSLQQQQQVTATLTAGAGTYKSRQTNYGPDQLFDIHPTNGSIFLVNQLDYEVAQVHELVIEAEDHGKPSRSTTTTVIVQVIDVVDYPKSQVNRSLDDKKQIASPTGQPLSNGASPMSEHNSLRLVDIVDHNLSSFNLNLAAWLGQMNSLWTFGLVFAVLSASALAVCFVRIKSHQPESDYNDTTDSGQTKPSPNHSSSNLDHPNGQLGGGGNGLNVDNMHHRHHDHPRRSNGSFAGLNGSGGPYGATPNGKMGRYQYVTDSSNLYHNPYPQQQQQQQQRARHHSSTSYHMQPDSPNEHHLTGGQNGSRAGTMTHNLHNHNHHHHHPLLNHSPAGQHHPFDSHPHQFSNGGGGGVNHTTSSLTYAHHNSRTALLQQAHHHQSSHQLSSIHQGIVGLNKGGTMNSVGTAHNHQVHGMPSSASPLPANSNTTHSSGLPANIHDMPGLHNHHMHNTLLPPLPSANNHHPQSQLPPPTPCMPNGSVFAWPSPQTTGSTLGGCCPGSNNALAGGGLHGTSGSTMDSCTTPNGGCGGVSLQQPLDRWFDLGVSSQLVYAHDLYGSYNWDYLSDWTPDYQTLMPLIQGDISGY